MESKKMIGTIEKKLDVKVEKVLGVTQEGNEMQVDVSIGSGNCMKVCLKEMKNQYGPYYKITFSESLRLNCLRAISAIYTRIYERVRF